MRFWLIGLMVLLVAGPVNASDIPPAQGYVNDYADLLRPENRQRLEQFLAELDRTDSTQISVLTVESLQGRPIEEYALDVAERWGIGRQGRDNGALLLVAHQDRRVRIEVGYGLEGTLTDLVAGRIIDHEIIPLFRQGDFDGGIRAGVRAMAQTVRGEYQATGRSKGKERNPLGLLFLLLFLGPGLLRLFGARSSHHRNYRRGGFYVGGFGHGGGRSGGFGGFGGGGFGGGGASGSW